MTRARGFTLLELLVAAVVSMLLLLMLSYVFNVSTHATRTANSRVTTTERIRALNSRLRRELGAMQSVNSHPLRLDATALAFVTDVVEAGRLQRLGVKYEFRPGSAEKPEEGVLVRSGAGEEILLRNVRAVKFAAPLPRTPGSLPANVSVEVTFGPEKGARETLETTTLVFPVYGGL